MFDPGRRRPSATSPRPERARRERARERSSGVTAYATDEAVRRAVFTVGGRMFLADLVEGSARELSAPGSVDDPRLDRSGERIAFVVEGTLHVREIEGGVRELASPDAPDTYWGLAEFVAAEEMDRNRGHWWSPDGSRLAATHVDERDVLVWYIGDPTDPAAEPRPVRYPQAGTDNAIVTLWVFDVESGERVEIAWDREAFPWPRRVERGIARRCSWRPGISARSGSWRRMPRVGRPGWWPNTDPWVELTEEAPVRLEDGRVVDVEADADADTYRLTVSAEPVTPPGLQVREVLSAGEDVLFRASDGTRPRSTCGAGPRGRRGPAIGGAGTALGRRGRRRTRAGLGDGTRREAGRDGVEVGEVVGTIENVSETSVIEPRPRFLTLGERELHAALLLPGGREPDEPLPVLMDPYGGPHGARVLKAAGAHLTSQWFADHGFAVLVVDGRGVDGRGPAWDREMYRDFTVALEDQVDALHAAAERFDFLDLGRVAMRGWSFGGELTAMALLRRPDVFHAGWWARR